jgi:DNA-binding CsgD family transcriptional regulator
MAGCVTCGKQLHPERAEKYNYCTDRKCQERNAKRLTILALGVNKAADHYQILDERNQEKVASGRYVEEMATGRQRERRSPSFGDGKTARRPAAGPARKPAATKRRRRAWTDSQRQLGLVYSAQGLRPDEIASKLGLSTYTVTQMLLEARNPAKP